MFWYFLSFVIAVCLWYLIKWLMVVRLHLNIFKKVPLHEDMNSPICTRIFTKIKNANDFFDTARDWVVKTGVQMYAMWVLSMPFPSYVIVKPALMKELLKLPITEEKGRIIKKLTPWIGDGLVFSTGQKWERNRRLLTPAFHFDILKNYAIVFNHEADIWLNKEKRFQLNHISHQRQNVQKFLCRVVKSSCFVEGGIGVDIVKQSSKEGNSVNIEPLIKAATLETMLRCALSYGEDGDVQKCGQSHPYIVAVHRIAVVFERRILNPVYMFSDFVWSLTADGKEFKKSCDYVHEFSSKIITSRRQILESGSGNTEDQKRRPDFLDILLQARDPDGKGLTDEEIRNEVDTFTFAGHDTTGSALTWSVNSLAKYPEEQAKVLDELEAVVGDKNDIEWSDLSELKYMTCFIKEVLRIYPPAVSVSRQLTDSRTINGIEFPKGTTIDGYIHVLHHHPDVWDTPEEFRPSRFFPENIKDKDPYAFIPFSAGPRNCIGQVFAMNEIKVFLAKMIKRFEIKADPERLAEPLIEVGLTSMDGVHLYFKDRYQSEVETMA